MTNTDKWEELRQAALTIALMTRAGNLPKHEPTLISWWALEELRTILENQFGCDVDEMQGVVAKKHAPQFPGDKV